MRVTFLGTGTSQGVPIIGCDCQVCKSSDPRDKRTRSSILVEVDDTVLLIDASPDLRWQFLNFYNKRRLDAVLLTHEHRDHVAGLDDLRPIIFEQRQPLDIYAHPRTLEAIKCIFFYSFTDELYPGAPQFKLHSIKDAPFEVNNVVILPIKIIHYKLEILGYKIQSFAYITDAKYIPEESMERLKNLDVLVVNALRRKIHYSHFNLDEALEVIERLKPKRAYLTHISHRLGKYKDLIQELPTNVFPAYDGLTIKI